MNLAKTIYGLCLTAFLSVVLAQSAYAQTPSDSDMAAAPPTFLRLEITSACTDQGAVFKIVNRGEKWPRLGQLRLFYADDNTVIGERRLRLAPGQKVTFVVKNKVMNGRPVAVFVNPEWYEREDEYDASINCSQ